MKKVTRFFSLLLAIAMVLAMNFGTFTVPAEETTYTLTINKPTTGHTYSAYQIFTGVLSTDGKTLSNIAWGSATTAKSSDIITALKTELGLADNTDYSAADIAALLTTGNIEAVAKILATYNEGYTYLGSATSSAECTEGGEGKIVTISKLPAGYYLVIDTLTGTVADYDVYSSYIIEVVGDATATTKQDTPEIQKKVDDKDDSTGTEDSTSWQDSADYDIGDAVPFQYTVKLPSNYADYDTYKLIFHDEQSDGLTFNNDVAITVYIDGDTENTSQENIVELSTTQYKVNTDQQSDSCDFEITISDLKSVSTSITASSVIVVTYTSTLNDHAAVGSTGNDNEVYLEYSNNPNDSSKTGKTPKDKVTVFTFDVAIHKVDSSGNPLGGADFTLYKYDAESTTWVEVSTETSTSADPSTSKAVIKTVEDESYTTVVVENSTEVTTTVTVEKSKFTFSGLDAGQYMLKETTTPDGYNTAADTYFTIVASHSTTASDPELTELYITDADGTVLSNKYSGEEGAQSPTFTVDNSAGISTNIINYTGAELPSTGGMGTKIFYTLGGVLVLGAGVLLIVKRRMRNA
ncbi:MAG: isopeptide-forming domain-containing fimbrial protein [Clostridiales bacterium]|nr:isopeptide-forming domain-containing fimbrial protein [Clostridiales bacterium]